MTNAGRDIRYAVRQLLKAPGFTATAVLTLAFGIGATTAIFSIVEGVLLRPLPFADPSRVVVVGDLIEGTDFSTPGVPAYESLLYTRGTHGFSSMGAYQQTAYEVSGTGDPAQVSASRLSAGVFATLGVSPLMGRRLKPDISPAQEQQDTQGVTQEIMRNLPGQMSTLRLRAAVRRLDESTVEASRPLVRALFLAVVVVLFIACANLAGLLLVRV